MISHLLRRRAAGFGLFSLARGRVGWRLLSGDRNAPSGRKFEESNLHRRMREFIKQCEQTRHQECRRLQEEEARLQAGFMVFLFEDLFLTRRETQIWRDNLHQLARGMQRLPPQQAPSESTSETPTRNSTPIQTPHNIHRVRAELSWIESIRLCREGLQPPPQPRPRDDLLVALRIQLNGERLEFQIWRKKFDELIDEVVQHRRLTLRESSEIRKIMEKIDES